MCLFDYCFNTRTYRRDGRWDDDDDDIWLGILPSRFPRMREKRTRNWLSETLTFFIAGEFDQSCTQNCKITTKKTTSRQKRRAHHRHGGETGKRLETVRGSDRGEPERRRRRETLGVSRVRVRVRRHERPVGGREEVSCVRWTTICVKIEGWNGCSHWWVDCERFVVWFVVCDCKIVKRDEKGMEESLAAVEFII